MKTEKEIEYAIKVRVKELEDIKDKEFKIITIQQMLMQEIVLLAWVLGGTKESKKILQKYGITIKKYNPRKPKKKS